MNHKIKSRAVTLCAGVMLLGFAGGANAAFADLDTNFGDSGIVRFPDVAATGHDTLAEVQVASGGKLYVLRTSYVDDEELSQLAAIYRLQPDGSIDTTFAGNDVEFGGASANADPSAVKSYYGMRVDERKSVVYLFGEIRGTNSSEAIVDAKHFDGSAVSTFGTSGEVVLDTWTGAEDGYCASDNALFSSDGGLFVAYGCNDFGDSPQPGRFGVVKIASNGSLDESFGNHGRSLVQVEAGDLAFPDLVSVNDELLLLLSTNTDYQGADVEGSAIVKMPIGGFATTQDSSSSMPFGPNSDTAHADYLEPMALRRHADGSLAGLVLVRKDSGEELQLFHIGSNGTETLKSHAPVDEAFDLSTVATLMDDGSILAGGKVEVDDESSETGDRAPLAIAKFSGDPELSAPKVTSVVVTGSDGRATTIATSAGTLSYARNVDQPTYASSLAVYPVGWFAFQITDIAPGSSATISLTLPTDVQADGYQKCTGTTCSPMEGATMVDNKLSFVLTDGGFGDADGLANGTITDPGAPFRSSSVSGTDEVSGQNGGTMDFELLLLLGVAGLLARHRYRMQ